MIRDTHGDQRPAPSVRLPCTTRGFKEAEMTQVAGWIAESSMPAVLPKW